MDKYEGTVLKVVSDAQHAFSKPVKESIALIEGHGVEGDAMQAGLSGIGFS